MSENGHKLTSGVLSLCETYGELSLATESRVLRLDHFSQDRNSSQVRTVVLNPLAMPQRWAVTGSVVDRAEVSKQQKKKERKK